MAYRIELTPRAQRDIRKLPKQFRPQVAATVDALAQEPRPHGVEQLTGMKGLYRVRAGDYRVIYRIEDEVLLVLVVRVGNRRDVYRGLSDL